MSIARRTPQLRAGEDGKGRFRSPWVQDAEWCTALPPPNHFRGNEYGVPGEPSYHRTLTDDEIDVAEALADKGY